MSITKLNLTQQPSSCRGPGHGAKTAPFPLLQANDQDQPGIHQRAHTFLPSSLLLSHIPIISSVPASAFSSDVKSHAQLVDTIRLVSSAPPHPADHLTLPYLACDATSRDDHNASWRRRAARGSARHVSRAFGQNRNAHQPRAAVAPSARGVRGCAKSVSLRRWSRGSASPGRESLFRYDYDYFVRNSCLRAAGESGSSSNASRV